MRHRNLLCCFGFVYSDASASLHTHANMVRTQRDLAREDRIGIYQKEKLSPPVNVPPRPPHSRLKAPLPNPSRETRPLEATALGEF